MGKGQAFLHNKFFHPSSKENLKRKWVAQQREKERLDRIRARQRQLELDRESQNVCDSVCARIPHSATTQHLLNLNINYNLQRLFFVFCLELFL